MYEQAYALYQQGHYQLAGEFFSKLCLRNPLQTSTWKGLASCLQMQSLWEDALQAWSVAISLTSDDAACYLHQGECLLSLHRKEEALQSLQKAELLGQDTLPLIQTYKELLAG
ncbi:MAG: hypothetical protein FJZ58_03935 [Chlamydiae bacterium]|nr:hypothetical protein [Chlamydiota bacterium]